MEFSELEIKGVYRLINPIFKDDRGRFYKPFNKKEFEYFGLNSEFEENYYSISSKNTIRGMHFQLPPHDHEKLVYVSLGKVLDVILDLRSQSETYKKYVTCELSAENGKIIYIPRGCAHGFLSLEDNSIVNYLVSSVYNEEADTGIRFDSFGMEWPTNTPILSKRDLSFSRLEDLDKKF